MNSTKLCTTRLCNLRLLPRAPHLAAPAQHHTKNSITPPERPTRGSLLLIQAKRPSGQAAHASAQAPHQTLRRLPPLVLFHTGQPQQLPWCCANPAAHAQLQADCIVTLRQHRHLGNRSHRRLQQATSHGAAPPHRAAAQLSTAPQIPRGTATLSVPPSLSRLGLCARLNGCLAEKLALHQTPGQHRHLDVLAACESNTSCAAAQALHLTLCRNALNSTWASPAIPTLRCSHVACTAPALHQTFAARHLSARASLSRLPWLRCPTRSTSLIPVSIATFELSLL
jgi:hypothetical protein